MSRLIGRFYFKKTRCGNLLGEYSHCGEDATRMDTEAATRVLQGDKADWEPLQSTDPAHSANTRESKSTPWEGRYMTTWCQAPDHECVSARLEITATGEATDLLTLTWTDPLTNDPMFRGEAMLCDDILVGDYSSHR